MNTLQTMPSDQNEVKLEISNRKLSGKPSDTSKVNTKYLNKICGKKEIRRIISIT